MMTSNTLFSRLPFWLAGLAGSFLLLSAQETGCKGHTADRPAKPATETRPAGFLTRKLQERDVSGVQRLNARARLFVEGDGQSIEANANLMWVRDSVLWVNVRKFGLEAIRALVTPDSVYILNRLDKTYTVRGLESLQREYNLPAGFDLLQSVLLAKAWILPDAPLKSDIHEGLHRLSGSDGRYGLEYRQEEGSFLLRREGFRQLRDNRSVTLDFDDYKKLPSLGQFPYLRHIAAFSPEAGTVQLNLELSDLEINVSKPIRFEIPNSYRRVP